MNMRRLSVIFLFVSFCMSGTNCVKSINPPLPAIQVSLMSKPWYLAYTDSFNVDSLNMLHDYRIPATGCEKQEALSFDKNFSYSVDLLCQPVPGKLNGFWVYTPDSTIGYDLATDTAAGTYVKIAYVRMITTDSLRLDQQSDFTTPHIQYGNLFQTKTYSH